MIAQILSLVIHIPLCKLFVDVWGYELQGLAYVTTINYVTIYMFVTIYSHCIKDI